MKLILSGGGIGEKSSLAYSLFAKELNGGKVLLIPLANEEKKYQDDYAWFVNEVKPFGISNICMVTSPEDITKELLESVQGIYVEGGNTFLLLYLLKSCNAFAVIQDFLNTDKVIMGGSAGALIFGKSIETALTDDLNIIASDDNIVGLKDMTGFNVLNGYSFFVHYRVKERQYAATEEKVQRLLKANHNLICLPEEDSVIVENGKITLLGNLPAEVIRKDYRKTITNGETI